ncbi:nucleotide sugar dehydrogenase [Leptospira yasudae]|uniref:nucleotide sugar dehydrogenase n=1 Tax=Leptospira yasudae TaxID=2202201 RepID=UPI001082C575|nr:nucleotide sugar dehydrogenase [Leptospira yasudae]TGK24494.1 nucleotide sugar dehydrogenase [Leptospira yasudae]TGM05720.1 nucleotide sugar dehydrogenase [Leptospira yasudae]
MNIHKLICNTQTSLMEVYNIFNEASSENLPVGIALVVDEDNKLIGTISDGDIRKAIVKHRRLDLNALDMMEKDPIYFDSDLSINQIIQKLPNELSRRNRKSKKFLSKIVLVDSKRVPVRVIEYHQLWEQRVATHRHLVVVGLGYVGLTLAATLADAGFNVTGVEIDESRVKSLNEGNSYIHEVGLEELIREVLNKNLFVSDKIPNNGDVFIITVGTPIKKGTKQPDLSYIYDACEKVGKNIRRGSLVILRSTIPVGVSRNIVLKKIEQISGLKCGVDFHLAFAPERTAEGRALKELRSLPQIIGGFDDDSVEATAAIFRDLTNTIIRVESLEAAEMVKLINNTYRDYIFAYSNQIAQIAGSYNLDVERLIRAANEGYPRDRVPYPSPGVGGPCLTKDSFIFASLSDQLRFDPSVFVNSRKINESMHEYLVNQVLNSLEKAGKKPKESRLLICGLAFKGEPETGDIRDSSALAIAKFLKDSVERVLVFDPVANKSDIESEGFDVVTIPEGFAGIDCVLFLNNHKFFEKIQVFDMMRKMNENPIVYDAWRLFYSEDIVSFKGATYLTLSMERRREESVED